MFDLGLKIYHQVLLQQDWGRWWPQTHNTKNEGNYRNLQRWEGVHFQEVVQQQFVSLYYYFQFVCSLLITKGQSKSRQSEIHSHQHAGARDYRELVIDTPCYFNKECTRLWRECSRFEPWPGTFCCVLGEDTLFSQCLCPPRCINGYQQI